MQRKISWIALVAVFALALPASAKNGLVLGFEAQRGTWDLNPATLSEKGGIPLATAEAFTDPLHAQGTNGLNLHIGWNVLGYAAVEAVLQSGFWEPLEDNLRGGIGLLGARATYFPAQHFFPNDRLWDVGVEVGGGYAIAGGPTYGMDGKFISGALVGMFYATPWLSVSAGYRHYVTSLNRFFFDYANDVTTRVNGFNGQWGTFFIGTSFHLTTPD